MRDLERMTFGERFVLTLVIVLVLLFALALVGYLTGGWEAQAESEPPPSKYDERLIALDREAVEGAYKAHIQNLYQVWMKAGDEHAAQRAATGARKGRKAFIDAMTAIDHRGKP